MVSSGFVRKCYRFSIISYLATGLLVGRLAAQDSLVAYVFLREDCLICQEYMPYLKRLQQEYAHTKVSFVGLFPNHSSDWADIGAFRDKYQASFVLVADENQAIARRLGATVTPEVILWSTQSEQVVYQGRIDNRYAQVGRRRRAGLSYELAEALQQWTQTGISHVPAQPAVGCLITFDPRD